MAQKFVTPVTIRNLTSASSDGLAVSVDGDTNDRIKVEAGGRLVWGSGSATGDANLYRSGVGAVKTDHTFEAESGVITLTSSGAPTSTIADGAIAVDTTNSKFYYRSNSAWNTISGGATVSTTAPSNPSEGDIWFDSNTGDTLVYYGSVWVDVGGSSVANIAVQTTAPSNPVNGDLWFDTDTAKTYVWYDDGTSAQWVEVGAASAAASGTDGAIQFASGGTFSSDASNLVWDDANNRLGIGTTSPNQPLHVVGNAKIDGNIVTASDALISNGLGEALYLDQTNNRVQLNTGGNNRVTVDSSGNVGIGTTSPATALEVAGDLTVDNSGTDTVLTVSSDTNALVRVNDSAGTKGADLNAKIWFQGSGVNSGMIGYNSTTTGVMQVRNDDGPLQLQTNSADNLQLRTNNTTRVTVDGSGNVGIGTTTPSELLDINAGTSGSVELTTTGGRTIQLTANDSEPFLSVGSTSSHSAAIMTNGVRRLTVDSSGNVGINDTAPTNILQVWNGSYYPLICRNDFGLRSTGTYAITTASAANVYISSNGTFYRSTSSGKYKTDVEDMSTDAADIVFALRPVWFRSLGAHDPDTWSYYGLIAEEVAEVDPRLVSFGAREDCGCDSDADHVAECLTEPEGVYYDRLVPHLISVIQRQQAQIDALTARIEALEAN